MSEKEIPTRPENADPMMAIVARLEGKIDRLVSMVGELFEQVQSFNLRLGEHDERISYVEHRNGDV